MRPPSVIVINKFVDEIIEVLSPNDDEMIQAFVFDCLNESFREGIEIRLSDGQANDLSILGFHDLVENACIL